MPRTTPPRARAPKDGPAEPASGPEPRNTPMRRAGNALQARPVLFGTLVLGVATALLLPATLAWPTRLLIAWCAATALFVVVASWRVSSRNGQDLARHAAALDETAVEILALSGLAAALSIAAVVVELSGLQALAPGERGMHLALALTTVVCSWFFTQTMFAIHYAHAYYGGGTKSEAVLDFGGDEEPDYWDFVYFTATIGATSQTSDVAIRSKALRRVVAAHGIFSFFFNTTVLALVVNISASLIGN